MTLFTGSPYEKMMIQKPAGGKRDKSPPASFSPRCEGCPYRGPVSYTHLYVSDRTSLLHFLNTTDCYHIATKNLKAYQTYLFHDQLKAILLKDSPFSMEIGWIKKKKEHLSEYGKEFLIRVQESLVLENLIRNIFRSIWREPKKNAE